MESLGSIGRRRVNIYRDPGVPGRVYSLWRDGHGWYTGYIQPGYTTYTDLHWLAVVMINVNYVNRKLSCDV